MARPDHERYQQTMSAWRRVCTVMAATALAASGCATGGQGADPVSEAAAPTQTVATPDVAAAPTMSPPPPVDQRPVEETALEERLEAHIEIEGGPDWLGAGFGSVWVKNDNGTVERIDPATNAVIAEIQTSQPNALPCQGLGVGAGAVWTCDETDLVRIDPATNAVTARIPVGKYADQGQLPVAFERVWVLTGDGSELVGIDPASNEPDPPITLGTRCVEVVAGLDALWAACLNDGRVLRIDPAGRSVTGQVPMPKASRLGVAENVWVAYEDGVASIDSSTLNVMSINTDIVPGIDGYILATADDVWIRQGGAFLSRMDPSTGVITEQIVAPDLPSGGAVLVANDSVWTTAYDHRALVRLRPHDERS